MTANTSPATAVNTRSFMVLQNITRTMTAMTVTISASIPMPFNSWKNGSRCPMAYISSLQSCIGWRYSKIRR